MPSLSRKRWVEYVPNLGNNREEAKPFVLLVDASLSKTALEGWTNACQAALSLDGDAARIDALADAFAQVVKFGAEPLTVDGAAVTTLREYLALGVEEVAGHLLMELSGVVHWHNSVTGARESFIARLRGGSAFTSPTAAKTEATPAGVATSL